MHLGHESRSVKMKPICNKGQGAMEYLMNYSWAILVVLVVGLALYQMGIFNQNQATALITGWGELKPEPSATSYLSTTSGFSTALLNVLGHPIAVSEVTMTETNSDPDTLCTGVTVNDVSFPIVAPAAPVTVSKGAPIQIKGTCVSTSMVKGASYNMHITIKYSIMTDVPIEHNIEGYIQGTME